MPYIDQPSRDVLDPYVAGVISEFASAEYSPGALNYVITQLCRGFLGDQVNYTAFNEVIGVLECAKQELYRRAVVPYENNKRDLNGEVYL